MLIMNNQAASFLFMGKAIFSTAYLGPVHYYARLQQYSESIIECFDSYQKQTYRNRCVVLGANGPLALSIPVVKLHGEKMLVRDVEIDYATCWQVNHWRTITSSYNSSPFFEYYTDDFAPFYNKKWRFLIDFNMELHQLITELIEIDTLTSLSDGFNSQFDGDDYRSVITPKLQSERSDAGFKPLQYTQTYSEKFGFVPNLSIIDLLFNRGPETESILKRSISV
jgi:hypothetical protein